MTTPTCATCKYLDLTERKPGPEPDETMGMCRYLAPMVQFNSGVRPWPFCRLTDWCGQWAAKPS